MIVPQPESDLTLSTIVVGADIISILRENSKYMIVEDILKRFISRDMRRSQELFFDTLTLLYALGIVREENYKMRLIHGHTQTTLF